MQPTDDLTPLAMPCPPDVERVFDYQGEERYVAFYWQPSGDEVEYDDGQLSATGDWFGWDTLMRHHTTFPMLAQYHFGNSEERAQHYLILDRTERKWFVAPAKAAVRFLVAQHPPRQTVHIEDWDKFTEDLAAHFQELQEQMPTITMEEIERRIQEKYARVNAMAEWLNAQPVPNCRHGKPFTDCPECIYGLYGIKLFAPKES